MVFLSNENHQRRSCDEISVTWSVFSYSSNWILNIETNFDVLILELFLNMRFWKLEFRKKSAKNQKPKYPFFDPDHIWRVFQLCHIHTWDTWHKCCCDIRHNTSYKAQGIWHHLSGKSTIKSTTCYCISNRLLYHNTSGLTYIILLL